MPSFVGRQSESARLAALLREAPVVTLTGPGGVGKTTLAARFAAEGVVWCDLTTADAGSSVAHVVAARLGGRDVAVADAEEALTDLVAGRGLLVVLDNCEHVIASAAAVAARLASGGARVLATSRESLGVADEHVLPIEPLGPGDAASLFAERAAAVRPGFALGADNAADVERLCRRLDGLPLAIELAAARARSLSAREIADRLDERFALLARRKSTAADRHRSLRAAVDWSYELLDEDEQALFARLGVFSTAVTLAEVEAVCGDGPVLDLLDALVDRSLVTVREAGGHTRYGMLETLRAYARERLAERGEVVALHDRHADHYVTVASALRLEEASDWRAGGLARMSDIEDVLGAVRWCLACDDAPGRAYRMLASMWAVVHSTAAADVTDLAERALARWGGSDALARRVLGVAAVGHFVLGEPDRARELARRAITAETRDEPAVIARRALALTAYHFESDFDEADRMLADVIAVAERAGASWVALEMSGLRGFALAATGSVGEAVELVASARAAASAVGARHLEAWTSYVLGVIALGWGSAALARAELERSLEVARAIDYPFMVGGSLRQLGVIAALEGDGARAGELLRSAIDHFRVSGDRVQRWQVLRSAAVALAAAGRDDVARRLLDGAHAARESRRTAPVERVLLARVLPGYAPAAGGDDLETLTRLAVDALSAPSRVDGAVFRREGAVWTLAFAGASVRMPHLKGLADLATLLAQPGREVHCMELVGDGSGQGDLGEVVDARGREAFRARVEELRGEIESARVANDPVREERARDELSALAEQLDAAYGLGGRARRAGDPAERARTAVAWRVRSALSKLDDEHAALARHLRKAVRTGTWCVYDPETPVTWEL